MLRFRQLAAACSTIALVAAASPAFARVEAVSFDIPAQDLSTALRAYGQQARKQVVFDGAVVRAKKSQAVSGAYTADAGLARLLEGTGLQARVVGEVLIIEAASRPQAEGTGAEPSVTLDAIAVTGSRIRGAAPAAPVIIRSREDMRAEGRQSLVDAIADIPQNFGGGQNPGVNSAVPAGNGVNVNGASSLNLRGLGSDTTLTLINGHRLAYGASRQSIDISTIPFEALDRIEVIADGASALYGADAVGGVANIILRRPYDGGSISTRLTGTAEGGGFSQQYGVGFGHTWASGGLMFAAEYGHQNPLWSQDRKISASRPGITLYPEEEKANAILSVQQDLSDKVSLDLDAMYNHRNSYIAQPYDASGNPFLNGGVISASTSSFMVSPTLKVDLPGDWSASIFGSYGEDTTHLNNRTYTNGVTSDNPGCYCNSSQQVEATADGRLFDLPAGPVKAAFGGGYRRNYFNARRSTYPISKAQQDYYAYGELSVPLVSEAQNIPLVRRLTLSAATRYEDYLDIDKVMTPKLGLVYAPTDTLEFKATWGKSFKAPTLFQQYNVRYFYIYPVASLGGTGYPSTATAIYYGGGNPDLKPERATSWTASLAWRPKAVSGLRLELSYFNVQFRDRIITPIPSTAQSFNALYAQQLTLSPSAAFLQSAYDSADYVANIGVTGTYDPSRVVAFVNNVNANAAEQNLQGVDASLRWAVASSLPGQLNLSLDGSYLDSRQTLIAGSASTPLSGTLYNPPKVRAHAAAVWRNGSFTVAESVTYTGGVEDRRTTTYAHVAGMTTFDTTLTWRAPDAGAMQGVEFSVGVQNMFNAMPGVKRTTLAYEAPYDSTNYSVMGRMFAVSVIKRW